MGFENVCTHPQISKNAVVLLNQSGFYPELESEKINIATGAYAEDEVAHELIVVDHFYDPRDRNPINIGGILGPIGDFAQSIGMQTDALTRGGNLWSQAITKYNSGQKDAAYTQLGHVLHLVTQDMAQPGHVHNDFHFPYTFCGNKFFPQDGIVCRSGGIVDGTNSKSSPLEFEAEAICDGNPFSGLPAFPQGTAVVSATPGLYEETPVVNSALTPKDFGEEIARASYLAAAFRGGLSYNYSNGYEGNGAIDLNGNVVTAHYVPGEPNQPLLPLAPCLGRIHWSIAGSDGTELCWDPDEPYDGTVASGFTNDWWKVPSVESDWNPFQADTQWFYFHTYDRVKLGNGQTLNDSLVQSQIPLSTNYSAGLIKLFAQSVDPIPPVMQLQLDNSNGPNIAANGWSRDKVFVSAIDPGPSDPTGSSKYPTPSGLYVLELQTLDSGGNVASITPAAPALPANGSENPAQRSFAGLLEGKTYQVHSVDGLNNHSYSTFTVSLTPPALTVQNELGTLGNGSYNAGVQFNVTATKSIAPVQMLSLFQNGSTQPYPLSSLSPLPAATVSFNEQLPSNSWYWVQACDPALNCYAQLFGSFPPGTTPPAPPAPPVGPPSSKQQVPPLPVPPLPTQPLPNTPPCLLAYQDPAAAILNCFPPSGPGSILPYLQFLWPGDPNSMEGPRGSVTPGQLMTYTIEFENVGDGPALGVYVKDVLDPALDETTLNVRSMYSIAFSTTDVPLSSAAATFPWNYDAQTRTVTLLAGNASGRAGGSFVLEARLRSTAAPGTVISNQGFVYFPNALQQITPTNSIVSAVPLPTQLASVGTSSAVYLSTAGLAAQLTAANAPIAQQPVQVRLLDFSSTTLTNASGQSQASTFLSTGAGNYNLGLNYGGDNFYYLPTSVNANFTVAQRNVLLQSPYAAVRPTDTVHIAVSLTDDRGQPLLHQSDEPKTVYLESTASSGTALLASSLLSGASAYFSFAVPQPLQLTWNIRARFAGDARYAAAVGTGTLSLIDDVPPTISLASPQGGAIFKSGSQISVSYSVHDNADLAPSATAYLVALNGSQTQIVPNGGAVAAASLSPGSWTVIVSALDWAGNISSATSGPFLVTSDVLPPRTSLVAGSPNFGSAPIYVSSQTPIILTAVDDRTTVGDGLGIGVAQTFYAIDNSSWSVYAAPFSLNVPGAHTVSFYSVDLAGNAETPQSQNLFVDIAPPTTRLLVDGVAVAAAGVVAISTDSFFFTAIDSASGVAQTLYAVDGATSPTVALSSFTLATGTHSLVFQSVDNVGNAESPQTVSLSILAIDTVPPNVAIQQPVNGSTVTTATPGLVATYFDIGRGIDVSSVRLGYDGRDFTSSATITASSASFVPSAALAQGTHTAVVQVADLAGNVSSATAAFFIDSIPPVTTLLVDGLPAGTTSLVIFTTDTVGLSAVDAGSGVFETLYALDGATAAVVYSSTFSLSTGTHALAYRSVDRAGNVETPKAAAITVLPPDVLPPRTTLVVGSPSFGSSPVYVSSATPLALAAVDDKLVVGDGTGLGVARTYYAIDAGSFTVYTGTFTLAAEGLHAVSFYSVDVVGNTELVHVSSVAVDAAPPVSSLVIGRPQFALSSTTVLVSSLTTFAIAAVDPVSNGVASGVRQTFYGVNGGTFAVYAASFTLSGPDGPQSIAFYSQDNVLNAEAVKVSSVVLDATPPAVALLSPGSCPGGICRVIKGKLPVLGSVSDAHLAGYVLDFAAGQNATTGYALISSGTVAVSTGALGFWDASTLSGWQTLRLTATDLVANASVATVNVFVGDPGELMILGNHDVFNMPQGVASDALGNVYVADTNADRIAVFTATGAFVTAYGQSRDDDDRVSSATVRLNKPKGVAVDAAGNIFIADTNENRVLKLSAAGRILLALGRQTKPDREHDGFLEFRPGKGLGEFNKPSGVASDAAGNIYVSDTNNNRVQVFSSTGAALAAFSLPPLPKAHDDERSDHDADNPVLGRPFGIALDAAGKIYVADPFGGRALVFGSTGQLLLTLPITGTTKDGHVLPGRPEGVAVSTDGYCLLVSDRKFDRVLKFDALGDQTLAFGAPGRYAANKPTAGIAFHRPVGLALAADGTLLVADRNNDRVERFGLPTGRTLVVPPSSNDDPNELAQDVLDSDAGGTVARADKAGVTIPPGALPDDLKITVSTISAARAALGGAMDQRAGAKGLAPAYAPVEYGPDGTKFNAAVTIVQPYDPNLVAAAGMSEDSLAIHYWNPAKSDWEALASSVDKAAHTVTAKTPHFSLYQVLGSTGTGYGVLAADASFGLKAAYAFPNPVHAGAVTIRIQPGLADSVSVRVYDISSRKIHESSDFTLNPSLDDGNGLGVQYTYDHAWDASGVGSGVYTYVITAKKAGQADIHKTGRVGVSK